MVLYSECNWASLSKPGLVGCQAPIAVYVFMYIYIAMSAMSNNINYMYFSYENGCRV